MDKAKILKKIIEQKYSSVKEFAQYCDLPYTTVYTILKNGVGKANVNNIIIMCKKLNITVEQLYNMTDDIVNGSNEIFVKKEYDLLKELKEKYQLTNIEYVILKSYLNLDIMKRKSVSEFIENDIISKIVDPIGNIINKAADDAYAEYLNEENKEKQELG